ncbi:MAG: GNAT family N-acetyltransferase [Methylophilaceae bacterium]|jgi:ribosomal protein S18 acetylase RimI-like enzyme
MLSFHKAELSDAISIAELVNSAYRGEISRAGWTTEADLLDGLRITTPEVATLIKREDAFVLVGVLRDQIIASIACEHLENTAKFGLIAVKPTLQNKGYGREMIKAAEAITAREWRVAGFYMSVITLRTELIEFYERLGFERSGQFEDFPENPALWQPKVQTLALEYLVKLIRH